MSTVSDVKFLWGAATAAFQIEGAATADGKGPSIWDVFCAIPGKIARGETGQITCDHYNRWRDDVELMRRLNLGAYRFSVSWPRVLPQGRGALNPAGMDFYDRLVDALGAAGIVPFVTLYHWDLPAALQMELGGWAHDDLPRLFADYAALLFDRLGDRVRHWVTFNEPWVIANNGYIDGIHAPGVRDRALAYRVGHNLARAHAYAAARLRTARHSGGQAGLAVNTSYCFPATDSGADRDAAERAMLGFAGWFADPARFGDYPAAMRQHLGALLPEFTAEDTRLLKNSLDFLGLNYYFSDVVRHREGAGPMELEFIPQTEAVRTTMGWPITPAGLRPLLQWLQERYGRPLYITENGASFDDQADAAGFVNDQNRIGYLRAHFAEAAAARAAGVDLRGYFVWSLLDNLEWAEGFGKRFGLVRCDFATLQRTIKASGQWYARFIAEGGWDRSAPAQEAQGMGVHA